MSTSEHAVDKHPCVMMPQYEKTLGDHARDLVQYFRDLASGKKKEELVVTEAKPSEEGLTNNGEALVRSAKSRGVFPAIKERDTQSFASTHNPQVMPAANRVTQEYVSPHVPTNPEDRPE